MEPFGLSGGSIESIPTRSTSQLTLRHLTLFIAAVVLVGCKPADKTADATTTTGSTPAAATDSGTTTPPAAIADDGKTDISGTWLTEAKDAGPVFEFKADKSFTVTGPSGMKGATLDAEGTYGVEGDKMTTKFTKMQMAATADADATTKKSVDEGNKKEAEALTKANADPEQTVKVVSKIRSQPRTRRGLSRLSLAKLKTRFSFFGIWALRAIAFGALFAC